MIGIDVVDRTAALRQRGRSFANSEIRWRHRHFTPLEDTWICSQPDPESAAWFCFASKEAAFKAGASHGCSAIYGDFLAYEIEPGEKVIRHVTSGKTMPILHSEIDQDFILAVVSVASIGESMDWDWGMVAGDPPEVAEATHQALIEHQWARRSAVCYGGTMITDKAKSTWCNVSHMGRFGAFVICKEKSCQITA